MPNKFSLLIFISIIIHYSAFAQPAKTSRLYNFVIEKRQALQASGVISLFKNSAALVQDKIKKILAEQQVLILNKEKSKEIFIKKPLSISLVIPFGDNSYQLELVKENISAGELTAGKITGKGKREKQGTVKAVHYRGYINGDPTSIASFSVFDNGEVMCLFANDAGNFNLGKIDDGSYLLYSNKHMLAKLGFECGTDEMGLPGETTTNNQPEPLPLAGIASPCKKVRIYWEADFKLYDFNFSDDFDATVNYLAGLFNQVSVMYQNESIVIELSELFVWTTADPYITTSSANGLSSIKTNWNALGDTFNGDLCVLIDGGNTNNGGRAYLLNNNICGRTFSYGYANIYGHYSSVPVYSWDVEVVTHEMGHMLGSHHTHWCGWNTGASNSCGAIDDCSTVETSTNCTTCSATTVTNPSAPAGFKGTVMSYCHLRSGIGISLANGFGPLPNLVMFNNINSSSCLVLGNKWTGTISTAWENSDNWSCGNIPDANTDVVIPCCLTNYPVINSLAICRKLTQEPNTSVAVQPGFKLTIVGTD